MTNKKMKDWSLLDPKPVLYFHDQTQSWLAVWNGIFMTAEHALMLTMIHYWHSGPSKEMVAVADNKMLRLYYAGVFDDVKESSWDGIIMNGVMTYYNRVMPTKIKSNLPDVSEYDSWKWFDKMARGK